MNRRSILKLASGAAAAVSAAGVLPVRAAARKKVLIITEAAGFRHSSIPVAAATVRELGSETGDWQVVGEAGTADQVGQAITASNLAGVDLVFFANTTGKLGFTEQGRLDFYNWMRQGGAYAGVHSAGDTFHGDPMYLDLVRGEFQTHGPQVKVEVFVQDPNHPACKGMPACFEIFDEIYEYKNWSRDAVHMLLTMHKHPQRDEKGDFPVAWTNRYGSGRMFYTSLGHREDVYANPLYRGHLIGGMRWALGLAKGDDRRGNPLI